MGCSERLSSSPETSLSIRSGNGPSGPSGRGLPKIGIHTRREVCGRSTGSIRIGRSGLRFARREQRAKRQDVGHDCGKRPPQEVERCCLSTLSSVSGRNHGHRRGVLCRGLGSLRPRFLRGGLRLIAGFMNPTGLGGVGDSVGNFKRLFGFLAGTSHVQRARRGRKSTADDRQHLLR